MMMIVSQNHYQVKKLIDISKCLFTMMSLSMTYTFFLFD